MAVRIIGRILLKSRLCGWWSGDGSSLCSSLNGSGSIVTLVTFLRGVEARSLVETEDSRALEKQTLAKL